MKKFIPLFLGMCFLGLASACGPDAPSQKTGVLQFGQAMNHVGQMNLSEVAKSASYIPLETVEGSFVGQIRELLYDGTHIYIVDNNQSGIKIFDKTGKFVRNINRIGNGPEEYLNGTLALSPANGNIFIFTRAKIMEYDIEGRFISAKEIPSVEGYMIARTEAINEHLFISSLMSMEAGKEYCAVVYDSQMNVQRLVAVPNNTIVESSPQNSSGITVVGIMPTRFFPAYEGATRIFPPDAEHILSIKDEASVDTAFVLDYGRYRLPVGTSIQRAGEGHYLSLMGFLETEKYVFLSTESRGVLGIESGQLKVLHDKTTGQARTLYSAEETRHGFINDLHQGPDFWPWTRGVVGKKTIYTFFDAMALLEQAENHKFATPLQKVVEGLEEDSNPVLMLVELK
jgi:hypothetical protein